MFPSDISREFFILGLTRDGKPFRPSDWAERLCGVLSPYRPAGAGRAHAHIGYSPYCRPSVLDGVKCVIVDVRLRELEPMAWDFALAFAKDNDLQAFEACEYVPPSGQT
ncbi:MAG: DUF3579 domain-containing protein [Burkholderiales bacterium]|jgi:hypothetical protein|nr:DUF3579 domain-containing protein [Burkholderiales bacterium]